MKTHPVIVYGGVVLSYPYQFLMIICMLVMRQDVIPCTGLILDNLLRSHQSVISGLIF